MRGSSQAIAMANGSLALSAAYLAVGLGKGDELITTPRTFIATASSAVLLGAKPVFAGVEFWRDHCCHHYSADHPSHQGHLSGAFGRLACRHASDL